MNELNSVTDNVTEIAKGITDYGALVIIGAVYILISALMMIAIFRWFRSIITKIMDNDTRDMEKLISKTEMQNDLLNDIADGLRPVTMLQIKNISNAFFDLAVERTCRIIKKVREENNIANKEATLIKITTLVSNLHEDRNSRLDSIRFRGHSLAYYTSEEWILWVKDIIVREVYADNINNARAFSNVEAVYSKIKLDFYKRLNSH